MRHDRLKKAVEKFAEVKNMSNRTDWFYAHFDGREISWFLQSFDKSQAMIVKVRSINDCDDSVSDYSAGCFYDTIKSAIQSFTFDLKNGERK